MDGIKINSAIDAWFLECKESGADMILENVEGKHTIASNEVETHYLYTQLCTVLIVKE